MIKISNNMKFWKLNTRSKPKFYILQKFCISDLFSTKKSTNGPQTKKIYSPRNNLLFDTIAIPSCSLFHEHRSAARCSVCRVPVPTGLVLCSLDVRLLCIFHHHAARLAIIVRDILHSVGSTDESVHSACNYFCSHITLFARVTRASCMWILTLCISFSCQFSHPWL